MFMHRAYESGFEMIQRKNDPLINADKPIDNSGGSPKALVLDLLSANIDIQAYIGLAANDGDYSLEKFGLQSDALKQLSEPTDLVRNYAKSIFHRSKIPLNAAYVRLCGILTSIKEEKVLGAATLGKLAFVKDATGVSLSALSKRELEVSVLELFRRTIELLERQKNRLSCNHPKFKRVEEVQQLVRGALVREDLLFHKLRDLCQSHPMNVVTFDSFFEHFWDRIVKIIDDWQPESGDGLEKGGVRIAYAERNAKYLKLGDLYGDCTAEIARQGGFCNVHDSVYAWMLDPHYAVLEVTYDSEPAIKGHILPLVVNGTFCLVLDAVETVPQLRPTIRGNRNPFLSDKLLLASQEMLELLLETTKQVAKRLGVDSVLIEPFSNTDWIRKALSRMNPVFVNVDSIEKPFGSKFVHGLVVGRYGNCEDFHFEIQAKNLRLMDQGLRSGWKELHMLVGNEYSITERFVCGP